MNNGNVASIELSEEVGNERRVVSAFNCDGKNNVFLLRVDRRDENGEEKSEGVGTVRSRNGMFILLEKQVDWSVKVNARIKSYIADDFNSILGDKVKETGGEIVVIQERAGMAI